MPIEFTEGEDTYTAIDAHKGVFQATDGYTSSKSSIKVDPTDGSVTVVLSTGPEEFAEGQRSKDEKRRANQLDLLARAGYTAGERSSAQST
jgi:hypothetical protein